MRGLVGWPMVLLAFAWAVHVGCGGGSAEAFGTDDPDLGSAGTDAGARDTGGPPDEGHAPELPLPVDTAAELGAPDLPPPVEVSADAPAEDVTLPTPDSADDVVPGDIPELDLIDAGPLTAARCFADLLPRSGVPNIDYDQFRPVLGTHCKGTNHQDIRGVERVVFAGDSITSGTPPTMPADWYRNRMAVALAERFGLEAPGLLWQTVNPTDGMVFSRSSGDFWCCSKWGARTDDITRPPHQQLITCNPPEEREKTTLIVMTVGGNDIFAWAQDLVDGASDEDLWSAARKAVADMEAAIHWAVDDPATFPNGVYVVFANTFEFTDDDSANDLASCPGAGIISMDWGLVHGDFMALATYFATEYMRIAVETGTDMVFLGEAACGHGHMRDDPEGRCYRGPDAELWLDLTCMHPSASGHAGIADLFLSTIAE